MEILKNINLKDKIQFLTVVSACFIFLQLPSLVEKQKISLEEKNKIWQGKAKVDKPVSWALINAYYVVTAAQQNDLNLYLDNNVLLPLIFSQ